VKLLLFLLVVLAVLAAPLFAQDPAKPRPAPKGPVVEVPTFANATCPIMGKPVSLPLFADTEAGRIHVCCKPCIKKVLADVATAAKTAYPTTKVVDNTICPVSGQPIGAIAVTGSLQGRSFEVCCPACLRDARTNSQVTLTRLLVDGVVDVGNPTCPITGEPVAANAFVLIGTSLVRLSSTKVVDAVRERPAATLERATALAAERPREPHVHAAGTAATLRD